MKHSIRQKKYRTFSLLGSNIYFRQVILKQTRPTHVAVFTVYFRRVKPTQYSGVKELGQI